jgi:hypothetical protein
LCHNTTFPKKKSVNKNNLCKQSINKCSDKLFSVSIKGAAKCAVFIGNYFNRKQKETDGHVVCMKKISNA